MEFTLSSIGPLIASTVASVVLGVQTFANIQYSNFKESNFYKGIERKNAESWDKINRNKDIQTLGANTTVNENQLKIITYKEGFVNEKIAQYIKTTKKIFNLNVKDAKLTFMDGFIDVNVLIDDNKIISAFLKPSDSKKTFIISDVKLEGFGNLESATKTTLENFVNLNKDFLSRYFSEKIEKIEVKKGEVVIYFTLSK